LLAAYVISLGGADLSAQAQAASAPTAALPPSALAAAGGRASQ